MTRMILRALACISLAASVASPLLGQNRQPAGTDKDPTSANLGKTVHLNLGATTVDALMAALSTQTGLTVKAADYLLERKLIVRMDNLSASSALDALNELNDWTWYRTNPNQILVTRRRLRLDVTPASMPRMLQAAIPRDMRTFLSIRTPSDDMSNYVNPLSIVRTSLPDIRNHDKPTKDLAIDQSALLTSLAPQLLTGSPIPYAKLDEIHRHQLLECLIFPMFSRTEDRLLHTDALPHVADVNNAVISLGATTLMVGSELVGPQSFSGAGLGFQVR